MAFVPVSPFQGQPEAQGGQTRKKRVAPPAYGAHAFHAPTSTAQNTNAQVAMPIPPPSRSAGTPPAANGHHPTSTTTSTSPAPTIPVVAARPAFSPSVVRHQPPQLETFAQSPLEAPVEPHLSSPGTLPASMPPMTMLPPPGTGKRDNTPNTGHRTRRLAAPAASFAGEPSPNPVTSQPVAPAFQPPQTSAFGTAAPFSPQASAPSMAISSAPSLAPVEAEEPLFLPSPALSPSMFSPVGKGADLFETHSGQPTSTPSKIVPNLPATSADIFDLDNDNEFSHFGITPRSSSSASIETRHTQAERVNRLFEKTPSPSPPPVATPSGPPQRPEISKSAASLFDEDSDEEPLTFSSAPAKQASAASPAPFVVASSPSITPLNSIARHAQGSSSDLFAAPITSSLDSDLFGDSNSSDELFDSPTPVSFHAPVSFPTPASPSQTSSAFEFKAAEPATPTPSEAAKESAVDFMSMPEEPVLAKVASPAASPVANRISAFSPPPKPATPTTGSPAPGTLQLTPNTADSLFGDDDEDDIDFGFGSAPAASLPQVQTTAPQPTTPIATTSIPVASPTASVSAPPTATITLPSATILPAAPQEDLFDTPRDESDPFKPAQNDLFASASSEPAAKPQEAPLKSDLFSTPAEPTEELFASPQHGDDDLFAEPHEPQFTPAPVSEAPAFTSPIVTAPIFTAPVVEAPVVASPVKDTIPAVFIAPVPSHPSAVASPIKMTSIEAPAVFGGVNPTNSVAQSSTAEVHENGEPLFSAPPMPSSKPAARASGPKRPRHFQYTAGQTMPAPTATDMSSALPPKVGAHPPLPTPASAPVASPPSFLPIQPAPTAFTAPIVAPTALNGGRASSPSFGQFNDSPPVYSPEPHVEERFDGEKKGSLFEPLGQLQSRGISWFKNTIAGVIAPSSDTPKDDEIETQFAPSPMQPPFLQQPPTISETTPGFPPAAPAPFPISTTGAASVPLPRVAGAAKKKAARPGPFKSTVAPPTAPESILPPVGQLPTSVFVTPPPTASSLAPLPTPTTSQQEKVEELAKVEQQALPPTATVITAPTPFMEDSPFNVSSGLVSIDYSAQGAYLSSSHGDPFGSDENVSATDLFSKLRAVKPSLNASVEILASPSTSQHLARLAALAQSQENSLSTSNNSIDAVATPSSATSALKEATPIAPITPVVDTRELEEAKALIAALKSEISKAHAEAIHFKESAQRAESQRDSSSQLVERLTKTESDLRSQMTQMLQNHESMSESQKSSMKNELEAANRNTQQTISDLTSLNSELTARNSELSSRLSKAEHVISELERAKSLVQVEHEKELARISSSANSDVEGRVAQLEKSLAEAKRTNSDLEALLSSKDSDIASWRSKLENERSSSRQIQEEMEDRLSSLQSSYESKMSDEARSWQQKERALNIELQQLRLSVSGTTNSDKRHADDIARITQDNERYVTLMQQQAASQTSVIDRLILQNAELVKAVEFARRVLQESKNPDSLGAALSENERLQEDLDAAESELATLRSRNKELEYKASHFESESIELVRRLNSIDYRLLHQSQAETPVSTASEVVSNGSSLPPSGIASPAPTPASQQEPSAKPSPTVIPVESSAPVPLGLSNGAISSPVAVKPEVAPASLSPVPNTPGDWQPKSPAWVPTYNDSPGKTPSRLPPASSSSPTLPTAPAIPEVPTIEPLISAPSVPAPSSVPQGRPAPFVVTAPVSQLPASTLFGDHVNAVPALPGVHHVPLSPHINLDDMEEVHVSSDPNIKTLAHDSPSPLSTPSKLVMPPQRGLMGRIWQAVTLQ